MPQMNSNNTGIRIILVILILWLLGGLAIAITLYKPGFAGYIIDMGDFLSTPFYENFTHIGVVAALCLGLLANLNLFISLGGNNPDRSAKAARWMTIVSIFAGPAAAMAWLDLLLFIATLGCPFGGIKCTSVSGWIPILGGLSMVAIARGFYTSIRTAANL